MRCSRFALLLLAASAGAEGADFASPPPVLITGFGGWQMLSGELPANPLAFGYRFYVNPERPALYSVMRYRLRAEKDGRTPTEKFLWVERPGRTEPMRCFELTAQGSGGGEAWRELLPGSLEYGEEIRTLMAVLFRQNEESRTRLITPGESTR